MSDDDANQQEGSESDGLRCRSEYKPWQDKETLEFLRCKKGHIWEDVAKLVGCSIQNLEYWKQKFQLGNVECPWEGCGDTFTGEWGMKIHHQKTHGESIAGVQKTCEQCGEIYTRTPKKAERGRVCSKECFYEYFGERYSGEGSPLYDRIELVCEVCGSLYMETPHRVKSSKYCSGTCYESDKGFGEREERICKWCGRQFETLPSSERVTCNSECALKSRIKSQSGQNSSRWRGGRSLYQAILKSLPRLWSLARMSIRDGYENQCQVCGKQEENLSNKLDIHHLIPVMAGGTNDDWNLIPLCSTCHRTAEWYTSDLFEPVYTDWTEDELPDGRLSSSEYLKRCLADGDLGGQATLDTFAD